MKTSFAAVAAAFLLVVACDGNPENYVGDGTGVGMKSNASDSELPWNDPANAIPENREKVKSNGLDMKAIMTGIQNEEYRIKQQEGRYHAANRAQNIRFYADNDGSITIAERDPGEKKSPESVSLRFDGIGRTDTAAKAAFFNHFNKGKCMKEGRGADNNCLARLEMKRGGVTEWYDNSENGVEQGFDVADRPAGNGSLILTLTVLNGTAKQDGDMVRLENNGKLVARYADLFVKDSEGAIRGGEISVVGDKIRLTIDDTDLVYPIEIDPIFTGAPEATKVESGQADALLGYSVHGAGDINGDGYDDIVVGAYNYDDGQTNEGVAYIYRGSATGIDTSTVQHVESNQAYAHLGQSVSSAGDVNNDGYDDIIVGAEQYDNGQNEEGAVFVYLGTSTGINTTATAIRESNQTNAKMGLSISGVGDIDKNGYDDFIAGAHMYDDGNTDEGAVFVYLNDSGGIDSTPTIIAPCNQTEAYFGRAVSGAGDIDGNTYVDFVVGAYAYDGGQTDEGRVYIYLNDSGGIDATPLTREKDQASAYFGRSVSGAGDINNDGYDDIVVGAHYYDNGQSDEGAVFVYFGASGALGTTPTQIESNQASAYFGVSVGDAGDIDRDGYADIIVGASSYDNGQTDEGAVFIYYGRVTGIGTTGVRLESNLASAYFGFAVSGAGDVNGDNYDDILVGAYGYTNGQNQEGAFYVYLGGPDRLEPTNQREAYISSVSDAGDIDGDGYADIVVGSAAFDNGQTDEGAAFIYYGAATGIDITATQLEANQAYAYFGASVSGAGDIDNDGYDDVVVGAYAYDNGQTDEGAAFVYYGTSSGIDTTATRLEENLANTYFGWSVSDSGDINGDGYADIIVGAPYYDSAFYRNEGAVYIYYGSVSGINTTATKLEDNQAEALFGYSVCSAGDIDGDGYGDIIVGAPQYDNGQTDEGRVFVYYGTSLGIDDTATLLEQNQAEAYFGFQVHKAGDINNNGYSDIVVGAHLYDNGQTDEGAAFIYYGSSSGINTTATLLEQNQNSAWFGRSVSSAGDVNNDGYDDVAIGASLYDNGQSNEGSAFLYFGSSGGIITTSSAIKHVESDQVDAAMGASISRAGDINNDGYDDVLVGVGFYDHGATDEGAGFIYYGRY